MSQHPELSPPPRRTRLLTVGLWVGLGLVLAAAFWLALGACGLGGPGGRPWLAFCPDPAVEADRRAALNAAQMRERLLEAHLDRLRLALAAAPPCPGIADQQPPAREAGPSRPVVPVPGEPGDALNPPAEISEIPVEEAPAIIDQDTVEPGSEPGTEPGTEPEAPVPEPPPVAEAESEDERTDPEALETETPEGTEPPLPPQITETDPEIGEPPPAVPEPPLPEERPADDPDAAQDRTPPLPPERPDPPDLPEEVLEEGDIAQLEGCWSLASPYTIRSRETGETYGTRDWEMCFGPDGSGTQTLTFENGLTCEGRVHAQFDENGNLEVIDLGNVPCEGGRGIDQRVTRCERQDGSVDCTTRHTTPPHFPVPVRFEQQGP